jgi:hypothetical protein
MVSRTKIGSSFRGPVLYLYTGRRDQPTDKQPELLGFRGIDTGSTRQIIADFEMGRGANKRLVNAVWHVSLSFNPADAERLDSNRMLEIAEGYLKKMGLDKTQYLIMRHHDTPDNQHVHIIANRVDDAGKTIKDGKNYYRSREALRELSQEHGLTSPEKMRSKEQQPDRLYGTELARYELKQVLRKELATATKLPELEAALQAHGVKMRYYYTKAGEPLGISFGKEDVAFKGSELERHYSLAGIQRQLAANAQVQSQALMQPTPLESAKVVLPASGTPGSGLELTPALRPEAQAEVIAASVKVTVREAVTLLPDAKQLVAVAAAVRAHPLPAMDSQPVVNKPDLLPDFFQQPAAETLPFVLPATEAVPAVLPVTETTSLAQPVAQQSAEQQATELRAAEDVINSVRREQAFIAASERELEQLTQQGDYGSVAGLLATIAQAAQRVTDYETQAQATGSGQVLLAEYQAQEQAAEKIRLAKQEQERVEAVQIKLAEQARADEQGLVERAVAGVRRERALLETSEREIAYARWLGHPEKERQLRDEVIPKAEQRLADFQLQATTTPSGQQLLKEALTELETRDKATQLAGKVLGKLASKLGFIDYDEFNEKAVGVGYLLPLPAIGQRQQVVELSSMRLLDGPVINGQSISEVLEHAIRKEKHQQTEWRALREARGRYGIGNKEAVRVRVEPAQLPEIKRQLGNQAMPDATPGADGRIGVAIIYNPNGRTWSISRVVEQALASGGEVFERPEDTTRREQSTRADLSQVGITSDKQQEINPTQIER